MATSAAAASTETEKPVAGTSEEFARFQDAAPRAAGAEKARTLAALTSTGVLSTFACKGPEEGFPRGSVVEHAIDEQGRPIFSLSSLSAHKADLRKSGRCSYTIVETGFKAMSQARFTLTGTARELPEGEQEAAKQLFLARNPNSFWVNFGDFSWWRLEGLVAVRFNLGFAQAGQVTKEEYASASPDPVAQFAAPIARHMNQDHADSMLAIVQHAVPLGGPISKAMMTGLDRFGMEVQCTDAEGQAFPCRVPFPRPATDRKSVRELVVAMTKEAEGQGGSS